MFKNLVRIFSGSENDQRVNNYEVEEFKLCSFEFLYVNNKTYTKPIVLNDITVVKLD